MALTITRQENTFKVEGQLNTATVSNFKTHLVLMLNCLSQITIDIDKVSKIDTSGLDAIKTLYNNAKAWNKHFAIVGEGCKDIYEALRLTSV